MSTEIIDQVGDVNIVREPDGHHSLRDGEGSRIDYDHAPQEAKFMYDQHELKVQGQLELLFE